MLEIYIALSKSVLTGASEKVLLILALFTGILVGKELFDIRKRKIFLAAALVIFIIIYFMENDFILIGIFLCYEILSYFRAKPFLYLIPLGLSLVPAYTGVTEKLLAAVLLGIIYYQHDFVVEAYRRQTREDAITEQALKHREYEMQEKVKRSLLMSENKILEERTELSQTLHDKIGHSINGSVYQLEAVKILMDKQPEESKKMIQAVIDRLRNGMDDIRAILRKEMPKKYKLALMQLEGLCEDCRQKGVDARLVTEGELKEVPEKYLEIILDNAYEAVSNSMKYAKCSKIKISVIVLNKVVRCSISDNGTGCGEIVDGMGISGMRKRVRNVNGILDFETEAGFTINMLLPYAISGVPRTPDKV